MAVRGDLIGRVLGDRYRLLAPAGSGASAHVFLAEDVRLRRRVALKVLHTALLDDQAFLRRFRAEAQAAAALNHPHIMRVFDWGEDTSGDPDDTTVGPFLVLEFLGGGSLRELLDSGFRLSPSQALLLGLEVARGLDYAHRRGLVHRDVKPGNLLFDDEGRICIADFGLARALAEAAWTEPTGTVVGTARYASPEQARGGTLDGRSDVYSLALVLTEAVTGSVPFAADTTIATLMARTEHDLEPPDALGPLGPVVAAAGRADPAERLDAAAFARALDRAAAELPAPAPLPIAAARADGDPTEVIDRDPTMIAAGGGVATEVTGAAENAPGDAPVAVALPASARPRRRRWLWVVVPVLLALLGAGGWYAAAELTVPSHPVPTLHERTLDDAQQVAAALNLNVRVVEEEYNERIPAGEIINQDPATGTIREGRSIDVIVSLGPPPVAVPDLAGLDEAAAAEALGAVGFVVGEVERPYHETEQKGRVLDWHGRGGQLPKGSAVNLSVSNGPPPVALSDWAGKPFAEAEAAMRSVGFSVRREDVFSDRFPNAGTVVSTTPGPGQVERGSTITVRVSRGPETVTVPDVRGKSIDVATAEMEAAGLSVVNVYGPVRGRVRDSDPEAGTRVRRGTGVSLYTRLL